MPAIVDGFTVNPAEFWYLRFAFHSEGGARGREAVALTGQREDERAEIQEMTGMVVGVAFQALYSGSLLIDRP